MFTFLAPHINITRSVYYFINMLALGRGLESEIPRVSDGLPVELGKNLKGGAKPILIERLDDMPRTENGFRAMRIPERQTISLINKMATPIEYFSLFLTPQWLQTFSQFTNKNAAIKRPENVEKWSEKELFSEHWEQRSWNQPTDGPEIGVFIGSLLIMGLEYRGVLPLYWSPYADIQGNEEIIKVIFDSI